MSFENKFPPAQVEQGVQHSGKQKCGDGSSYYFANPEEFVAYLKKHIEVYTYPEDSHVHVGAEVWVDGMQILDID